ncbi:MAG: hypothetical protein HYX79_07850 [Chloroflexi bacterium]|nr:hypothetical protein [Chloroflexota bacterium]
MVKSLKILLIIALVLLAGCAGGENEGGVRPGEEFTLSIGQTVAIRGESLQVGFLDVVGDSRCPKGVVCVWQGEVSCAIRVTVSGVSEDVIWKQPGLTDERSRITYKGYQFAFEVESYPEAGKTIGKEEYRIRMVVSKG